MKWALIVAGGTVLAGGALAVWYILTVGSVAYEAVQDADGYRTMLADSPQNASYMIGGKETGLTTGGAGEETEGGELSGAVRIIDSGIVSDINGDGILDTVVLLRHEEPSRAPAYYLAVALKTDEGYIGSEAHLLGEREPVLRLFHDVLTVTTTDAPIAEGGDEDDLSPRDLVRYFSYYGTGFTELGPFDPTVEVVSGHLTRAEEGAYVMRTCKGGTYTLSTESPSYVALEAIYAHRSEGKGTERVFMVLAGEVHDAGETLTVSGVISAPEEGGCAPETETGIDTFNIMGGEEVKENEERESAPLPL